MSNSNGFGVKLGFQFTSFDTVNKEFQNIIKRLSDTGKVDLKFNLDNAKISDTANKIKEQMSKLNIDTTGFDKVINQQIKSFSSGASQQIVTLKNSANEVFRIIQNLNNQGETTSVSGSVSSKANIEAQVGLYKELTNLIKGEFDLKKQLINADELQANELNKQLVLNKEMQAITGKAIGKNGLQDSSLSDNLIQKRLEMINQYNSTLAKSQDKNNNAQIQSEIKVWEQYEAELKKVNATKDKLIASVNVAKGDGVNNSTLQNLKNQINNINVNTKSEDIDRITSSVNNLGNSSSKVLKLTTEMDKYKSKLDEIKSTSSDALGLGNNDAKLATFTSAMENADSVLGKLKKNSQSVTMTEFQKAILDVKNSFTSLNEGVNSMSNAQSKLESIQNVIGKLQSNGLYNNGFLNNLQAQFDKLNVNTDINKINEFQAKIKSLGSGESGINKLQNDFSLLTNKITALESKYPNLAPTKELNDFKQALQQVETSLYWAKNGNIVDGNKIASQVTTAKNSFTQLSNATKEANNDTITFGDGINRMLGHLSVYFGAYQVINATTNAIKEGLQTVLEMDTAMADLNKVVNLSSESLQSMTQSATQMGQEFGRSVTEVAQSQAELGRLYKNTSEINELTQASLLGANVMGNSTPEQVSKSLTTIMTAMKINAKDSVGILDSMNEIKYVSPYIVICM